MCVKYKKAVELRCAGVNTNEFANPQQSSYICTKVIQSWSLLWSGQLDEPAKKYYNPVATGAERKVLAMCNVRKEVTLCLASNRKPCAMPSVPLCSDTMYKSCKPHALICFRLCVIRTNVTKNLKSLAQTSAS